MAYGKKYTINWQARFGDLMRFDIYEKDYIGGAVELTGSDDVCNVDYESDDDDPPGKFKVSKCRLRYLNETNIPLLSFYSEDDEFYKGQLYANDVLKWVGFMVQDDCSEELADLPYIVELVFTDAIGLLKELTFDEACQDRIIDYVTTEGTYNAGTTAITIPGVLIDPEPAYNDTIYVDGIAYKVQSHTFGTNLVIELITGPATNGLYEVSYPVRGANNLIGKLLLWSFIRIAIQACNLPLPVRCFNNIFEAAQDEDLNMFNQTRLFSGKYVDDQGTWQSIYDIVYDILFRFRATIVQADGFWNVIRWGEAYRFTDNEITGHSYDENFENETHITLSPNYDPIETGTDNELINADGVKRIIRPLKMVKETFNYDQPAELIRGIDFQRTGPLFDSEILTESGIDYRYDYYEVNPSWRHEDSAPNGSTLDSSYVVVKTQLTGIPIPTEIDRYLYNPNVNDDDFVWLQTTPIEVSKGDFFDFSYSYKAVTHTPDADLRVHTRFILFLPGGGNYALTRITSGGKIYLQWNGVLPDAFYKVGLGISRDSEVDTEFENYHLLDMLTEGQILPPFPADGVLVIGFSGSSDSLNNGSISKADVVIKNIKLDFFNSINDSTDVIGQTHTDLSGVAKNTFDEEIQIDDSPRNVIAGTLFLNLPQQFQPNIGMIYFTKTEFWGFKGQPKTQRLGQLIVNEQHFLRSKPRAVVDCSFVFHLPSLTPMNVIFIDPLSLINFIFGVCSFDYMNMICNATLIEAHADGETGISTDYTFNYLYEKR